MEILFEFIEHNIVKITIFIIIVCFLYHVMPNYKLIKKLIPVIINEIKKSFKQRTYISAELFEDIMKDSKMELSRNIQFDQIPNLQNEYSAKNNLCNITFLEFNNNKEAFLYYLSKKPNSKNKKETFSDKTISSITSYTKDNLYNIILFIGNVYIEGQSEIEEKKALNDLFDKLLYFN